MSGILSLILVIFMVFFYINIRNEMFSYFEAVLAEVSKIAFENIYTIIDENIKREPLKGYIDEGDYEKFASILLNYDVIVGVKIDGFTKGKVRMCPTDRKIEGCGNFVVMNFKTKGENIQIFLDISEVAKKVSSKRFELITEGAGTQIIDDYRLKIVEKRIKPNAVLFILTVFILSGIAFYRLGEKFISHAQSESSLIPMIKMLEKRDPYTAGHSKRVAQIARDFARYLGVRGSRLKTIYKAGLLHDIGKIGIPEKILLKPGKLLPEEYEIVKKHPLLSEEILKSVSGYSEIARIVKYHHERCDGKGYPSGLRCEQIPFETKIVTLADVYDALTSERAYRKGWSHEVTLKYIEENAGTQFDPTLAIEFVKFIRESKWYKGDQKVA